MESNELDKKLMDVVKQFLLDSVLEIELVPINKYSSSNRKKYHLKVKSIKQDKTGTKVPLVYPIAK